MYYDGKEGLIAYLPELHGLSTKAHDLVDGHILHERLFSVASSIRV